MVAAMDTFWILKAKNAKVSVYKNINFRTIQIGYSGEILSRKVTWHHQFK